MMPSTGQILCAPFTDETLYNEQVAKAQYWTQVSEWCREYTATTSCCFLVLGIAPCVSCLCVDALCTLRNINFRRRLLSSTVSRFLQPD